MPQKETLKIPRLLAPRHQVDGGRFDHGEDVRSFVKVEVAARGAGDVGGKRKPAVHFDPDENALRKRMKRRPVDGDVVPAKAGI